MNPSKPKRTCGPLSAALVVCMSASTDASGPVIGLLPPSAPGAPVQVEGTGGAGTLLRLEAGPALNGGWQEIGRYHDSLFPWADGSAGSAGRRFYRLLESPRTAIDDWKNQILGTEEVFRSAANGDQVRWVKFSLKPAEPWRVYFQDSTKYPFHYDFATQRLAPFSGMSRPAFDSVTLHTTGQQLVLGAVLYPPRANLNEFAVQFVGLDAYTPAQIAEWFRSVGNAVHSATGAQPLYMPVYEQAETARVEAAAFAALGVSVAAIDRWTSVNHVYSPGWALGRLRYVPGDQITAAFTAGTLLPTDILLTDGLPAETPLVAGIIALTPQTPNSHTAILAQSFGIPFVHTPDAAEQMLLRTLDGRKVVLRATSAAGAGTVKVIDAEGVLPPAVEADLLALKAPQPIGYTPRQPAGLLSRPVEQLQPADVKCFGGKAVNYGLLRRTIPANCPAGIALSFDLWDAFLDQNMPAFGRTLRAEIAARLAPHQTFPPPQMAQLKTTLSSIRALIRQQAQMPAAQQAALISALSGFDPMRKIRFRSSTNLEDGTTFTGAGLYDSYSGCLADDTDGDTTGPSHCDPDEPEERGVFRAIQRVFASYYNDNAYLERIRHGVVESECGMAVLVHHSFPDEHELANGVASLKYGFQFFSTVQGELVTQLGAESVTNPDGRAAPEVVDLYRSGTISYFDLRQSSSRVPLGAKVMQWETDYRQLTDLFVSVGNAWRALTPARNTFSLDFEYKKDANLGLIVKQVREIPQPAAAAPITPWNIEEPNVLVVAQREAGTVWGNHRLKSRWNLRATSGRLTPAHLAGGFYREGRVDYADQGSVPFLSGALSSWPGAGLLHGGMTHTWTTGAGSSHRTWQLATTVTTIVSGATPPVFGASDFPASVSVTYATPQPALTLNRQVTTVTSELAYLEAPPRLTPGSIRVVRDLNAGRGLNVRTVFFWPDSSEGATGGYTAPLIQFESTTITGLLPEPIVLTGYYSQTYRPGHHNFTEEFIFEPGLDENLPAAQRSALQTAGIQALHITGGLAAAPAFVLSTAGSLSAW